ncbi:MAG: hypothetical protein BZY80_05765 [SAR202 cluster bacterium Io17-Chloro-G2]|nr:MAG: hypothetical protein BZY80_05765 [SAR202 cluster bacterium Io17-Chloro-G2]
MSRSEFVRLLRRAYSQVPPEFRNALDNVDVTVEEWPDSDVMESVGGAGVLFGLYDGVPLPEREGGPGAAGLPDRITIYRQPILRSCKTRAQAEREIRVTLWHELGHYLGLGEDDLDRLGYG